MANLTDICNCKLSGTALEKSAPYLHAKGCPCYRGETVRDNTHLYQSSVRVHQPEGNRLGWQCPNCKAGVAPDRATCPNCAK